MLLDYMESIQYTKRINPSEVNIIVYEKNGDNNKLANTGIINKTFRAYNINVIYKTVDENWEEDLNNVAERVVFLISSDTFISKVKRKLEPLKERNNNVPVSPKAKVLVVLLRDDDDNEDDDDDSDDDFDFETDDSKDKDIIKVDSFSEVYKWWPDVLLFLRPKGISEETTIHGNYGCFFVCSDNSIEESEWFKKHRDSFQKLGIRCIKRGQGSRIPDEVYMKNSKCVVVYVNKELHADRIKQLVKKAIDNNCKIRLYLENEITEFAKRVQDDCHVKLSGTTVFAHVAGLLKDLDIIDVKRRKDNKFYSETRDTSYREIFDKAPMPVTTRDVVPDVKGVYSFEQGGFEISSDNTNTCTCSVM